MRKPAPIPTRTGSRNHKLPEAGLDWDANLSLAATAIGGERLRHDCRGSAIRVLLIPSACAAGAHQLIPEHGGEVARHSRLAEFVEAKSHFSPPVRIL